MKRETNINHDYVLSKRASIGKIIKEKRKQSFLTLQELSEQIGTTIQTIDKIENGLIAFPTDLLIKLSIILDFEIIK